MTARARISRRVFVLGHRGMLGSTVSAYLGARGHDVRISDRRYGGGVDDELLADVRAERPSAVVNCLGVVSPSLASPSGLMLANALLPQHLAATVGAIPVIHASTDCVYDGKRGWYAVGEPPSAVDPYGLSKRLGEACAGSGAIVLRTSIVGPSAGAGRGLLGWFLGQHNEVDGWVDHMWNGITTLAWAQIAASVVEGLATIGPGIHQPTCREAVSKCDLLHLFADTFNHRIEIRPVETGSPCDRTLIPTIDMPPLAEQLRALRSWDPTSRDL
jgi:dTDP-4-dehydrorhamnose reductase